MKFAKEGWPFVLPFVALSLVLAVLGLFGWSGGALLTAVLVLLFFRDPKRGYEGPEQVILAPADGLITRVELVEAPELGPGKYHRIVTFLSVFDVHVQKSPTDGVVLASRYSPGKKVAAFREDAGEVNEKHLSVLRRANGDLIGVVQIAGLLARRVVCYLSEGESVVRRQPLGVIKFSSRVDLLLPETYQVLVRKGDRVQNGATPMATPPGAAS